MPTGDSEGDPRGRAHTYPYLVDEFFYSADNVARQHGRRDRRADRRRLVQDVRVLRGPQPGLRGRSARSTRGTNFDWYRQDLKPGLLNLNLIIDEEVFFGLMSTTRG